MSETVQISQSDHRWQALASAILSCELIALVADVEGRIVYATPACERRLGLGAEDRLSPTLGGIFDLNSEQQAQVEQCWAHRRSCTLETEARPENAAAFPVRLVVSPIEIDLLDGVAILVTDISEYRQTQKDLQASEQKLQLIYDHAFDGICLHEEYPDGSRALLDCNERYAEMAGRSRQELLEIKNTLPLQQEFEAAPDRSDFLEALHEGRPYRGRFSWIRPDGRDNLIEYYAMSVQIGGKTLTIGFDRDVTKQVQTTRALEASEEKYRLLVENANDAILVAQDGMFKFFNAKTMHITGYSFEELASMPFAELIHPEDRPVVIARHIRRLQGEVLPHVYPFRIVDAAGRTKWVEINAMLFTWQGRPATLNIVSDITDRMRALEALAESEERYRLTIDALDDLVHVVDRDLRFVLYNDPLAQRMAELGFDANLLGERLFDALPFLPPRVYQEYQQVLNSGESLITKEATRIGDAEYWTETRKIPILNEDGTVGQIVTVVRDITHRVETDRALWHRLEIEELVTDISTRFIHIAPDELEGEIRRTLRSLGELVDVDRCYLHLFSDDLKRIDWTYEWSAEGIASREHVLAGLPVESLRWAMERIQRREVMHVPRVADLPPEAQAERARWMAEGTKSLLSIPITREGAPIGALGFSTLRSEKQWSQEDIRLLHLVGNILSNVFTHHRSEKEKLELESKLEHARLMESLGVLAGGVAHDLNNLLGPLVGYPDLLLMDLPADSPSRQDVLLIKESAERAAAVVQDLLTLARRGAYRMTPVDLNQIVKEYMRSPALLELRARNPGVLVNTELAPDLLRVRGSVPHLTKALMNLVANAFEAMPYGGRLTVGTSCQSLDRPLDGYEYVKAGDYVVLEVSDTGVGIEGADLGRIFEPFYTKKELGRSGSGLGLAVVYGVVHDHEGRIDLHTELGRGTRFALYLPITHEALPEAQQDADHYRGDETVLVIDDLETQRQLATRLLSSLGYRVDTVESGRVAVAYLVEREADILVLDMIMEDDFDGLDAYRAIVQTHPRQKAVIASGYSETERVKEAQRLGAGPFLKKPYTLDSLGKAVRQTLDQR